MNWKRAAAHIALFFFLIIASIEFLSLFYWLLQPLGISSENLALTRSMAQLESQIFYAIAPLTPALFTLFMFCWIAKPFLKILKVKTFQVRIGDKKFSLALPRPTPQQWSPKQRTATLILAFSMAAATLLTLYPYSPALNPDCHHVGVDIHYYAGDWLPNMANQTSILQTINYAFSRISDRPLGLLLMYAVYKTTGFSTWNVAMFLPAILAPLTVLATYYFSREARLNQAVTCLAAVFTIFSYHLTTGIFAGFLSNWMAIIGVYIFSGLLMHSVRLKSGLHGFLAASTMVLVLFTHAETWGMLMGVMAVFALLQLFSDIRAKRAFPSWNMKLLTIILAVNASATVLRNYFLSFGGTVEVLQVAQSGLSLQNIAAYWSTVTYTFNSYMFGTFLNLLIILLSLIGALAILTKSGETREYLISWLLASTIPFILGTIVIQARILYNLPISVFAAQGLYTILSLNSNETKKNKRFYALAITITILFNLNYALRILFALPSRQFP